jgi:hypothetical protein
MTLRQPGPALRSAGFNLEDQKSYGFTAVGDMILTNPALGSLRFDNSQTQQAGGQPYVSHRQFALDLDRSHLISRYPVVFGSGCRARVRSCLSAVIAWPTAGFRSSATAQAKKAALTSCLRKTRNSRQTPARLPYSKNDSLARSLRSGGTGDGPSPVISRRPMP